MALGVLITTLRRWEAPGKLIAEGSANRLKAKAKLAGLHARIAASCSYEAAIGNREDRSNLPME